MTKLRCCAVALLSATAGTSANASAAAHSEIAARAMMLLATTPTATWHNATSF
eukprot:SAG31_NODE_35220_length_325_cov_0.690265_1_plen_52_part_10